MDLLLDTHALIWFAEGSEKLSPTARKEIDRNNKFISIASLWEIVIKSSINKLELKSTFVEINQFLSVNNILVIDIKINHLETLLTLPHNHGDPFDRLIISQAISENLTIISADKYFKDYSVKALW